MPLDLPMPFTDNAQRREADTLGMHVFLATEIMMFGALFVAIFALRIAHSAEFISASMRLNLPIALANTALLLTSSLLAALAVEAVRHAYHRRGLLLLAGTVLLAIAFLVLKAIEYRLDFRDGLLPSNPSLGVPETVFLSLYYLSTGLHALHVIIGISLFASVAVAISRTSHQPRTTLTVKNVAIYWHFVDIVWVFLLPALYLARN